MADAPPLPKNSDAWIRHLRPWLNRRIEQLRDELERSGAPVDEYRGRIAELRELIQAVDPNLPDIAEADIFPPGHKPS